MTTPQSSTYGKHPTTAPPTTTFGSIPMLRDVGSSMISYREPTRADLVERIREGMRAEADGDLRLSDQLTREFSIFHDDLIALAALSSEREDIRAHAAKLWVRTIYSPPNEDVRSCSRHQTKYQLPAPLVNLVVAAVANVPTLVRLGILAGLDEVADFRLIEELMTIVPDEVFQREAKEVLADAE